MRVSQTVREFGEKSSKVIKRIKAKIDDIIKGVGMNCLSKKALEQVEIKINEI